MTATSAPQPDPAPLNNLPAADWLLDTLPWGLLVLDERRVIRRINQQAAHWCGTAPEVLLGCPLPEAALPPVVAAALRWVLEAADATPHELFLPRLEQWITFTATRQPGGWVVYGHDITSQKQREQQYQALADNTPDVLMRWTPDLRLRYANPALAEKAGAPLAALLGKTNAEMGLPDEVASSYLVALQHVFDTGQPQELTHALPTAQGVRTYHSRLVPELRDGQIDTVLGIARDLTELHQAQAQAETLRLHGELARQATDQHQALLHSMDEGLCLMELIFDAGGERAVDCYYREVNPAFLAQSGMPTSVLNQLSSAVMPDAEPFWLETYGRVARTGEPAHFEHYVPQLSRWFAVHAYRVGPPEARQVAALFTDVTARKQATEALQTSEAKYRTLFESMDQGFGIGQVVPADAATGTPLDWQWLEVNPQFERLTGLTRAGVLGQTTRQLIPGLEEIWYERYAHVAATGEPVTFESFSPVLSSWFDVYAFALGPPATRRVGVLFTNTTERRQAEAALRQAETQYREQLEQQVAARTAELKASRNLLQTTIDSSAEIIQVFEAVRDAAGEIVDFVWLLNNRTAHQLYGDVLGKSLLTLNPGVVAEGIFDTFRQVVATGVPNQRERHYVHEQFDGWFLQSVVKQADGVATTTLDITARKQTEQERFKNLYLLEQAEAVVGLGSWEYDLRTERFTWSDGMYHLFDLPVGEPVQLGIIFHFIPEEGRAQAAHIRHCITTGAGDLQETVQLRVNGQLRTVRIRAVVLRDEQGQPQRMLGVNLDISELHRLEADNLHLRLTQQRVLFEAVQAAQEAERKRMAESLHNGIGQILYATKLRLDRLPAPETDPALATARHEATQLLSDAIRQTRALSHELVPLVLEEFGLAAALRGIGTRMSTPQLRLHCLVLLDEEAALLPPALQLALYRMAQELAQNIIKHAHGATEASLELETMPGWVLLRAEDDGAGFAAAPAGSLGLGLRSIRDRVALLGGKLELGAVPAGGAYVRIRIPLPDAPTP